MKKEKPTIKKHSKDWYCAVSPWLNGFSIWDYGETKEAAGKALVKKINTDIKKLREYKADVQKLVDVEVAKKKINV